MNNMILAQPESVDNKCNSDQLIVTGGAPVPAICGTNTGQHSKWRIGGGLMHGEHLGNRDDRGNNRTIFDKMRPERTVAVVRDNKDCQREIWRHAFKYYFRLDLDPVILAGPEPTDHTCLYDQFYVTGGSNPVPTICGTNIGHHSKSLCTMSTLSLQCTYH